MRGRGAGCGPQIEYKQKQGNLSVLQTNDMTTLKGVGGELAKVTLENSNLTTQSKANQKICTQI